MASDPAIAEVLLSELTLALGPLRTALADAPAFSALLQRHGWVPDPSVVDLDAIDQLLDIEDRLEEIDAVIDLLADAQSDQLAAVVPQALETLAGVFATLRGLVDLARIVHEAVAPPVVGGAELCE